jgi:tRNA nucleotidyltransferase/poly(A) polymerase
MRLTFSEEILALFKLIQQELGEGQELYLVGGAVRDAHLNRRINDLDFAMAGSPIVLAKQVAKRLKVGSFVLDDDRHTSRVLYQTSSGKVSPLDFVQFTGGSLEQDLRLRDFTLNAMAVSLRDLSQVIDPLHGQADLTARLLRPCSAHALLDDPVRVLRGIRLALQYDLQMVDPLPSQMQIAAEHLPSVSYERQRDEFFKILEGPDPAEGMRFCQRFGVFRTLIPSLDKQDEVTASPPPTLPLLDHAIAAVEAFHRILAQIQSPAGLSPSPWWLSFAGSELSSFAGEIETYFSEEITRGRSKQALAIFGTLLHNIGKPLTVKMGADDRLHDDGRAQVGAELALAAARQLQLSNAEAGWVQTMVSSQLDLLPWMNNTEDLSRREIYWFFNQTEAVGVAIAFLKLADTQVTFADTLSTEDWERMVQKTKMLLSAWWNHKETLISPPALLDGHDLQKEFGLAPGERIGRLLEALREAQAVGKVSNLAEAKTFIRSRISPAQEG